MCKLGAYCTWSVTTAPLHCRWHAAGNVGVEHAAPQAIRQALQRSRRGDAQRSQFSREALVHMGLVAPHHLTSVSLCNVCCYACTYALGRERKGRNPGTRECRNADVLCRVHW